MVMQLPVVPERDLLDPVSARSALPDVGKYQRQYTFYSDKKYETEHVATLVTALDGADVTAKLVVHTAPSEYCLPVKKDRRFSPVFQVKVCCWSSLDCSMDVRLCAYPLSAHERQALETGISEERPKLPDQVRDFVVHEIEPVFVDKHTHFRKPFHIARRAVSLRAGQETEALVPFEGLEFEIPSFMSPMTIAFAACIGDRQDVALVLMTPATISVCRADQRADAATRLGYSKQVFDRVNDRNGGQKYKTVFNPPSRSRGNGRRRRTAAAPAAAGAPPAAGPWPPHAVNAAVQAPAIVATYATPHYAPAGTGVWQPDLPQSAPVQHGGEAHAAGRGGSLGADSPAEHGPFFLGSGAARRRHSLDPILAQAVEDLQMGNLPTPLHVAGNASVFEDASEPWFTGWVPHEGHTDLFADKMDWDDFITGNPRLADYEGIGEGHGGHAASAPVSWSDLSSFCADPPLVVAPQATPAATQMPAPSAVDLARGAETPCTSADAAGGAAAAQAFGQQGVPHYLRPECQPVPTAVALRGRNLQQVPQPAAHPQPAARPQLTPGGAAPEGDLQMAADERLEPEAEALKCFHAWLEDEIWMDLPGAPEHSAFGAAEDVLGFQQYQRQSLHEGTAADLPFVENRDRDDDVAAWPLRAIYNPEVPQCNPASAGHAQPWRRHCHERAAVVQRSRERSPRRAAAPARGGRSGGPRVPGFEVSSQQGEVLDLQGLLEPRAPPMGATCMWPDQREAPFYMAEGFDHVQLASGGPAAGPPPGDDVAQGAQGTWLDLQAPKDDGGDAGAAPVGFGDVQAPGLFAGMQPTQGARNLQDLLQLRSRDAAAASAHPAEPAAIPPQGEAAVEAAAALNAAVPMPPDDELQQLFAPPLALIEDPFDGCNDVLGDGFMDLMGSDLDFDPESGAFPVDLRPMP